MTDLDPAAAVPVQRAHEAAAVRPGLEQRYQAMRASLGREIDVRQLDLLRRARDGRRDEEECVPSRAASELDHDELDQAIRQAIER